MTDRTNPENPLVARKAEQASQETRSNSETHSYGDQFQAIRTVGGCEARIAQAVQEWHKTEQYEEYPGDPTGSLFVHGSDGTPGLTGLRFDSLFWSIREVANEMRFRIGMGGE